MIYGTVYVTILHCTVLYCTAYSTYCNTCCTLQYCTVYGYCTVLYCIGLWCIFKLHLAARHLRNSASNTRSQRLCLPSTEDSMLAICHVVGSRRETALLLQKYTVVHYSTACNRSTVATVMIQVFLQYSTVPFSDFLPPAAQDPEDELRHLLDNSQTEDRWS